MAFSRPVLEFLGGLLAILALAGPVAAGVPVGGWELEKDVDMPTYAFAEPSRTDVNIDTVVLSCEQGPGRHGLQLRIFLSGPGPLAALSAGTPKGDPRVEVAIDGEGHEAWLLFADDFIIVTDSSDGGMPLLSDKLVRALQRGRQLELRFDLHQEQAGQAPAFDGSAVVELQAGRGGPAVAMLRRCAGDRGQHLAESPRTR